jgi:hypothetical protein
MKTLLDQINKSDTLKLLEAYPIGFLENEHATNLDDFHDALYEAVRALHRIGPYFSINNNGKIVESEEEDKIIKSVIEEEDLQDIKMLMTEWLHDLREKMKKI